MAPSALVPAYGPGHEVIVYEAAPMMGVKHSAIATRLEALSKAPVTHRSTLYVPPLPPRPMNREMLRKLGMQKAPARRATGSRKQQG